MGVEEDITGDGGPEFIITDNYAVSVFGCRNGKYEELFSYTEEPGRLRWIRFTASEDMNVNGIPELIINAQSGHTTAEHSIGVYEWNGERIESIIRGESYANDEYWDVVFVTGATSVKVQDVDGNGTKELILTGGIPYKPSTAYEFGLPWREETNIYEWNGQQFVLADVEYSPPEYRFQAVQDGDRLTMKGEYDQAIDAYQEAIFSDQLEWWSAERWSYEIQKLWAEQGTVLPTPVPDSAEYWNLAAYARFRLLLIHVLRGETAGAEIIYNTLREKFA